MGGVKSVYKATPSASDTTGLITSGAGVFYGVSVTSTATTSTNSYIAVYDASAGSSGVYDYNADGLATAASRLLWIQQVRSQNSGGGQHSSPPVSGPVKGVHFFNGLVVAETNHGGTAEGSSALNALVVYRSGFPSNDID